MTERRLQHGLLCNSESNRRWKDLLKGGFSLIHSHYSITPPFQILDPQKPASVRMRRNSSRWISQVECGKFFDSMTSNGDCTNVYHSVLPNVWYEQSRFGIPICKLYGVCLSTARFDGGMRILFPIASRVETYFWRTSIWWSWSYCWQAMCTLV